MKEKLEQQKCIDYLSILEKQNKIITFFAPMNENIFSFLNRDIIFKIEKVTKKMGKRKGVSDLVVILKDKILFVELKKAPKKLKNGKLSYKNVKITKEQKNFLEQVNKSNVCEGFVAYGFNDFYNKIQNFL